VCSSDLGLALQDKDITVYGEGRQLRNVSYVDDAVQALLLTADCPQMNGDTFFAVGDEHWSVSQIAEITVEQIGAGRVKYVPWPEDRKATEIGDAIISNKKIKQILPWSPKHNLRGGLSKTREYYCSCLEHYIR
jgi:UDP-glucose 4-epimerase